MLLVHQEVMLLLMARLVFLVSRALQVTVRLSVKSALLGLLLRKVDRPVAANVVSARSLEMGQSLVRNVFLEL